MSWKQDFTDHTTNIAFNLSLSKDMVHTLRLICTVCEGGFGKHEAFTYSHFLSAGNALVRRGLVGWNHPDDKKVELELRGWYITPAGWHVVSLLRLAELIPAKEVVNEAAA
jgi:hypothetical protein